MQEALLDEGATGFFRGPEGDLVAFYDEDRDLENLGGRGASGRINLRGQRLRERFVGEVFFDGGARVAPDRRFGNGDDLRRGTPHRRSRRTFLRPLFVPDGIDLGTRKRSEPIGE